MKSHIKIETNVNLNVKYNLLDIDKREVRGSISLFSVSYYLLIRKITNCFIYFKLSFI